ncbi:site-specific DNA-methyltransferase [Ralstonia sp.]|uniref:DNA-methyltransferase n=1 Tax=Ralstonia sp. TaxID=54061 RepID=UPI00257D8359|nr:site-specific DNA-methyltransferase [Ralstonia sp.]MBA4203217.1 DNA adenine methylase [Ralstonia sp.]
MNLIQFGDCRELLRVYASLGLKAQACVTSPPYFGLRDYGHPGQLGMEQTPEQYVAAMVEVFRCVRDVLADDGTLWLNIGDSYAGSWGAQSREHAGKHAPNVSAISANQIVAAQRKASRTGAIPPGTDLKPKDLIGIPWMLAFALRADGWYLRQDIIWSKPNPMPESVLDRCTKAHEYVFLLSKSGRYYFDSDAVKEPAADSSLKRWAQQIDVQAGSSRVPGKTNGPMKAVGGPRSRGLTPRHSQYASCNQSGLDDVPVTATRNRRSVWTVATRPYKGAHFATYPPELIVPCILAGSRPGDVVLDPFMGSGTTAAVALQHGRQYLGCELNPEYRALQQQRIAGALAR